MIYHSKPIVAKMFSEVENLKVYYIYDNKWVVWSASNRHNIFCLYIIGIFSIGSCGMSP